MKSVEEEINLVEIFNVLKQKVLVILGVTAVFVVFGFLYTKLMVKPLYTSEATVIVNNKREEGAYVSADEMNSARNLANVYSIIIKSDNVTGQVIENLSLNMKSEELSKKITVSPVDNSQVIKLVTKDTSAERAYKITGELVKVSPKIIEEKVEAGSVKVISDAKMNSNKVSPSLSKNLMLSAILGLVLSSGYFIVSYLLDNTFKSETEIEKILGLPTIGIVPNVDSVRGVR
ncbi:YveK family protein [Erysipelothrix urinaevulpis]|nr:Wzz/FepE/Etk N-terminal domain-containing protein [Erysipelothrix urinaevulpis]